MPVPVAYDNHPNHITEKSISMDLTLLIICTPERATASGVATVTRQYVGNVTLVQALDDLMEVSGLEDTDVARIDVEFAS